MGGWGDIVIWSMCGAMMYSFTAMCSLVYVSNMIYTLDILISASVVPCQVNTIRHYNSGG